MRTSSTTALSTPSLPALTAVLAGALCLSVSAIIVRLAGVDAATTAVLRCAIAIVPLLPLALVEAKRHERLRCSGVIWSIAAGIALGVDYSAWTASIYRVGAGVSTVLINVQVIVLPLLALLIDRERTDRRFICVLPLMLAGIALVGGIGPGILSSGGGAGVPTAGHGHLGGVALGLLAGIGYGGYLFLTRRATSTQPKLALQPLMWATATAATTSAIIAGFSHGLHVTDIGARSWALLIALALVGQVAAWLLIHHGSARLPAGTTASLLLVQPVLALALSALILGERFGVGQILGSAVVVVAVAISSGVGARPTGRA